MARRCGRRSSRTCRAGWPADRLGMSSPCSSRGGPPSAPDLRRRRCRAPTRPRGTWPALPDDDVGDVVALDHVEHVVDVGRRAGTPTSRRCSAPAARPRSRPSRTPAAAAWCGLLVSRKMRREPRAGAPPPTGRGPPPSVWQCCPRCRRRTRRRRRHLALDGSEQLGIGRIRRVGAIRSSATGRAQRPPVGVVEPDRAQVAAPR